MKKNSKIEKFVETKNTLKEQMRLALSDLPREEAIEQMLKNAERHQERMQEIARESESRIIELSPRPTDQRLDDLFDRLVSKEDE